MKATEHELTVAVEAAAKQTYEANLAEYARRHSAELMGHSPGPAWEEMSKAWQLPWREAALPVVQAILEALPNRARAAWREGYEAGEHYVSHGGPRDDNPHPED